MNFFISHSEEKTAKFAAELSETVTNGSVIALHGSLGAGKTVFSRGFARGLGITDPIPSPTFTIVQEYEINFTEPVNLSKRRLFHMDLYRISDSNAALAFGIDEYLYDNNAVKLIEWPDRITDLLPEATLNVYITHIDEISRKITIT